MSKSAEGIGEERAESQRDSVRLRSDAQRVASGLNLLRWALIAWVGQVVVINIVVMLLVVLLRMTYDEQAWVVFTLRVPCWVVAPLALMGVVRILKARDWSVHRGFVIAIVVFFALDCAWTPLMWVKDLIARQPGFSVAVAPYVEVATTAIHVLLSLLYLGVLFAGCHLARTVDEYFDRSLISKRHRILLLWVGVVSHVVGFAAWAVVAIWDLLEILRDMGYSDSSAAMILVAAELTVGFLIFAWVVWLLVVTIRVHTRLRRFVSHNRCPRCNYDLREGVVAGCPECGWMRQDSAAVVQNVQDSQAG